MERKAIRCFEFADAATLAHGFICLISPRGCSVLPNRTGHWAPFPARFDAIYLRFVPLLLGVHHSLARSGERVSVKKCLFPRRSLRLLAWSRAGCCTFAAAEGMTDYGESEIFAPDWFGDASPDNSLHTVDDGRWAYLPVMKASNKLKGAIASPKRTILFVHPALVDIRPVIGVDAESGKRPLSASATPTQGALNRSSLCRRLHALFVRLQGAWEYVHNPYGLLRSPWNLDGTPFVTRYNLTNGQVSTKLV